MSCFDASVNLLSFAYQISTYVIEHFHFNDVCGWKNKIALQINIKGIKLKIENLKIEHQLFLFNLQCK